MPSERIPIEKLKPGMFLTGMDISWIKSPFLLHTRKINDSDEIDQLKRAGVKEVTIDPRKGVAPAPDLQVAFNCDAQEEAPPSVSINEETKTANIISAKGHTVAKEGCESIRKNQAPSSAPMTDIIQQTIASLFRNNQAMLGLLHIGQERNKLFSHLFNVMSLSLALGTRMGCSESEKEILGLTGFIHDAGWSRLPLNLLSKHSPYSDAEMTVIERHTSLLNNLLLEDKGFDPRIVEIISEHHERLDGSGYPGRKKARDLHPLTKILMVAETYDELIQGMMGYAPMTPTQALETLYLDARDGCFDIEIVSQLINTVGIYPVNSVVELSSGEIALVKELNRNKPVQPTVKVFYGENLRAVDAPYSLDLSEQSAKNPRHIVCALNQNEPENDPAGLIASELEAICGNM